MPPLGSVLMEWTVAQPIRYELLLESSLKLLDRPFSIGAPVKRHEEDYMSGIIVKTVQTCSLRSMDTIQNKNTGKTMSATYSDLLQAEDSVQYIGHEMAHGVPASELQCPHMYSSEDLVIYRNWIGRVGDVIDEVTLRLYDNSVVVVRHEFDTDPLDSAVNRFSPGDIVRSRKANLRTGRWIFGAYNPNLLPVGVVVEVRAIECHVDWLYNRGTCIPRRLVLPRPMPVLGVDELYSDEIKLYDQTSGPQRLFSDRSSTLSSTDLELSSGLRVVFRDLAGACVKYDGSNGRGKVTKLDRRDTLGYNMNVFTVTDVTSHSTVQWQDLSITVEPNVALIPESEDDEHTMYPGEIIHTQDTVKNEQSTWLVQPTRVGIAQSVSARDRTVQVRWCPSAQVRLLRENNNELVPDSHIGSPSGPIEEVTIYDVNCLGSMNNYRGDFVFIRPPINDPAQLALFSTSPTDHDWIGEVVDQSIDGVYTVRLGAGEPLRDIQVAADGLLLAFRADDLSDTNDSIDDDGMSYEYDSNDDDSMEVSLFDQEEITYYYPHGSHQLGGGGSMLVDDDNDDAWTTENEGDVDNDNKDENENGAEDEATSLEDSEMPRVAVNMLQFGHLESYPEQATAPVQPFDDSHISSAVNGPPAYSVLENEVPSDHHYTKKTPPSNLRAILKEHKILRAPSNLPEGVYVRTWESRMDLLRILLVGPLGTPYAYAPFAFDILLPPTYPNDPPLVFFHSWGSDGSGQGRVNPNLYEDGKVCLSLLGTWNGDENRGESWIPRKSTVLQVLISLLGLVLVREPYFSGCLVGQRSNSLHTKSCLDEAGYETLQGLSSSRIASILYNERTYLRARGFIASALVSLKQQTQSSGFDGLTDVLEWLYLNNSGPRLLKKALRDGEEVITRSGNTVNATMDPKDGTSTISKGACLQLRRVLRDLSIMTSENADCD